LRVFYEQGFVAVDLFFLISGFIFFWLYRDKLAGRKLSLVEFGVFRFSRLYPLHLATLLVVALLQFAFMKATGQFFVYPSNDLKHFLASVLFIQQGGDSAGFNGPEWSLTIEIMMYGVFCLLARFGLLRNPMSSIAVVVIGLLIYARHENIARGLCGFFIGGLMFDLFEIVRRQTAAKTFTAVFLLVSIVGWSLVVADIYAGGRISDYFNGRLPLSMRGGLNLAVLYGLFPITLLTIALHEVLFGARYGGLAWLGEISYSSYLLHFPLQLVFALIAVTGLLSADAVRSPLGQLAYIGLLIPLSLLVFRLFEAPAQNALRAGWATLSSAPALRGFGVVRERDRPG
jgi:peptidoglycan/LPS O-acetylase OafA/YrhL